MQKKKSKKSKHQVKVKIKAKKKVLTKTKKKVKAQKPNKVHLPKKKVLTKKTPAKKVKVKTTRKTTPKTATTIKPSNSNKLKNEISSKQQEELNSLIAKGKDQGYLTFTEINDHLPPEIVDPDQIEDIIGMLNEDVGIPIYDENPEAEATAVPIFNENASPPTVAVVEEEQSATVTSIEDETGRTSDPVRMYMREMGTVELLTRGGEIAIAKRIEEGSKNILSAIAHFPGIIEAILNEYVKTETTDKRLQDIISGFYDIEEWHTPPVDPKKMANADEAIDEDDYPETLLAKTPSNLGKNIEKEDNG